MTPFSTTSRSIASAKPTASSRRAAPTLPSPARAGGDGRDGSSLPSFVMRPSRVRRYGPMTIARPVTRPSDGLSFEALCLRGSKSGLFPGGALFAAFKELHLVSWHDGRYGVLVD